MHDSLKVTFAKSDLNMPKSSKRTAEDMGGGIIGYSLGDYGVDIGEKRIKHEENLPRYYI
jgi:hypothetical protein